jgi:predicted transposase YbfD/YdcC
MRTDSLIGLFDEMIDPRVARTRRHKLTDILVIALVGTLSCNSGWDDMVEYAEVHEKELRTILELPNGIPSADTLRRVICALDPKALQEILITWAKSMSTMNVGRQIAIDGKSVRNSFAGTDGTGGLHLVHAWACDDQLLLGQFACDVKSNEITAIPELLTLLDLKKSVVTIDAMGCQTEIAGAIVAAKADYVLALKSNHPKLYKDVIASFDEASMQNMRGTPGDYFEDAGKGHGRLETKQIYCLRSPDLVWKSSSWANLQTIVLVDSQTCRLNKITKQRRFYLSSLDVSAEQLSKLIRNHWHIENKLHWVLDVTFNEDRERTAKTRGTLAMATLRRLALGMIRGVQTVKPKSLVMKMRATNWRFSTMLGALTAGFTAK